MKKRLCLLLALVLVFLLAACNDPEPENSAGDTTSSTNTMDITGETGDASADSTEETGTASADSSQSEESQPDPKVLYCCIEEKISYSNEDGGSVITRTFDEKGNLLTEFYKSNDGLAGYGNIYTYDENNNVLTHKTYDVNSRLSSETTNTYNEAGQLISQFFTNSDGDLYNRKSDFTYDNNGLLVKKVDTNPTNPGSEFHYIYTYNSNGNLVKEEWININNGEQSPHSQYNYTYDANGNKLSMTNSFGAKTQWTYDDRGNMLSVTEYDSDGFAMFGTIYTYDAQNRLLTETWCKGDIVDGSETYEYEYDAAGNRINRYRYMFGSSKDGLKPDMKYTYDAFGNLLTEESFGRIKEYKYIVIELPSEEKES